jgi:hypothetical protein
MNLRPATRLLTVGNQSIQSQPQQRRGFFMPEEMKLKCFQVGDSNLVAAYTQEQALEILIEFGGYDRDDIGMDEVAVCTDAFLDAPCRDEEGNECEAWRCTFEKLNEPGYVGGWE